MKYLKILQRTVKIYNNNNNKKKNNNNKKDFQYDLGKNVLVKHTLKNYMEVSEIYIVIFIEVSYLCKLLK